MTGSGADRRSGRPAGEGGGREVLFEKSREEHRDTERDQPVECFGFTFENDEARRTHFRAPGRRTRIQGELPARTRGGGPVQQLRGTAQPHRVRGPRRPAPEAPPDAAVADGLGRKADGRRSAVPRGSLTFRSIACEPVTCDPRSPFKRPPRVHSSQPASGVSVKCRAAASRHAPTGSPDPSSR